MFATAASFSILDAQRLARPIDGRAKMVLRGSHNPRIDSLTSEGPVDDAMRIRGITLRFQPTGAQSAELERLLDEQQDPNSPLYHAWFTPEEYGRRFGLTTNDVTRVADWIAAQGFHVDYMPKSRTYISFSGTAAQVRAAFDTEVHRYTWHGRQHFANVRDVAIPVDLESIVYPPTGLDDFGPEGRITVTPRFTYDDGSHAITPGDLSVIYNLAPLYKKGINGAGQKIVVAGRSSLKLDDVRGFREAAGLPPSEPKLVLTPGSREPGYNDAAIEAIMDVDFAGGAAPGATILYVYGEDAAVLDPVQYAVDQNLAPVITYSYGLCEARQSGWPLYRNVAQQATAQGITWVASSGDAGAAGCESQDEDRAGASGLAVQVPASLPEVTGVGGAEFAEGAGRYWSPTYNDDGSSALSYIPEKAWNDTSQGGLLTASGGGVSTLFARPNWQIASALPADNARHVPDLAFTASAQHDPYLIFNDGDVLQVGGTSAATPFFAGVVALLNQYVVTSGGQPRPGLGNINPRLYQLAQTTRGVFHDITSGNNIVPCKTGTKDCTKDQYGYTAGPGYDSVTGLGSLDAANFVENWAVIKSTPTSGSAVVPSVEPSPVYEQTPDADGFGWFYTVRLTETAGAPTRVTAFSVDDYDLSDYIGDWFGSASLPANGSVSVDLRSKDQAVPSNHVFAFAGVDNSGQKWAKQVTVSFLGPKPRNGPAMSLTSDPAVVLKIGKGDPDCAPDHPYSQTLYLRELNGAAVKLTKFIAGGYDYSDWIGNWFGSQTLPASGTLQAKLCWQLTSVPVTLDYEMDGVDDSGRTVQATLTVQFTDPLGQKSGALFEEKPVARSSWPGRKPGTVTPRVETWRRAATHQTPSGMTVGIRPTIGSASASLVDGVPIAPAAKIMQ
jgi:hypothetical protein